MIKRLLRIFLLSMQVLFVGISGCKKCYNCYAPEGAFWCYKGADSIGVTAIHGIAIEDSLKHYHDLGYRCDTLSFKYEDFQVYFNPECGKNIYHSAMAAHDKCETVK
jgi:hypothetical protein